MTEEPRSAEGLKPSYTGDWPEDFPHENGNYINRCCMCTQQFWGHKRRVVCKVCASKPRPTTDTVERAAVETILDRWHADMTVSGSGQFSELKAAIRAIPSAAGGEDKLREALEEIDALPAMEINPSNYTHDDVCELNDNAVRAALIARAALQQEQDMKNKKRWLGPDKDGNRGEGGPGA